MAQTKSRRARVRVIPRRAKIHAIHMIRCDGTKFHFERPFERGEIGRLMAEYQDQPRAARAVCEIQLSDRRDNQLARYERWARVGGEWTKSARPGRSK